MEMRGLEGNSRRGGDGKGTEEEGEEGMGNEESAGGKRKI